MKARKLFTRFEPYQWEPSNEQIAASLGMDPRSIVRFDTNTSPYAPKGLLKSLATKLPKIKINEYPDTSYSEIREALARYASVSKDQLTVTNGADEGLDIIAKTLLDQGSEAIISSPTYSYFRVVTQMMGGNAVFIERREDFSDDIDDIIKALTDRTRAIFLCSPNSPTGNCIDQKAIEEVLHECPCAVVVDEAYWEFSGRTFAPLTESHDNLIVVRTFSKAFSLAGARVGYLIASEGTIELLNKVRPPNSLSVMSLPLARLALDHLEIMRSNVKRIVRERGRCYRLLQGIDSLHVYPSEGNFLLLKFREGEAKRVNEGLLRKGLVLRTFSSPRIEGCLRFVVSLPRHNDRLIKALREVLQG